MSLLLGPASVGLPAPAGPSALVGENSRGTMWQWVEQQPSLGWESGRGGGVCPPPLSAGATPTDHMHPPLTQHPSTPKTPPPTTMHIPPSNTMYSPLTAPSPPVCIHPKHHSQHHHLHHHHCASNPNTGRGLVFTSSVQSSSYSLCLSINMNLKPISGCDSFCVCRCVAFSPRATLEAGCRCIFVCCKPSLAMWLKDCAMLAATLAAPWGRVAARPCVPWERNISTSPYALDACRI